MTTQNLFYSHPNAPTNTGFYFADLATFEAELTQRHDLCEYELQFISGYQIDQALFTSLKINQTNLTKWFTDIQPLTNEEKVGLWFLFCQCGYDLTHALAIIQDGMTIYHGTKEDWAGEWLALTACHPQFITQANITRLVHDRESKGCLLEFRFAGETWVGDPLLY